jgi:glycosyltransferase involved in cell wall biosynthesis
VVRSGHVNDVAHVGSTLVRALQELGEDAVLVDPPKPWGHLPYPAKAATLPLRAGIELATGLDLRRRRFDIVHVHYATHALLGPLSGAPFVVHCHGSDIRSMLASPLGVQFARTALRRARRVYVATPDLLAPTRRLHPDPSFLPNPIDVDRFAPTDEVAPDRDILIGVRIDAAKGASLIAALAGEVVRLRPGTTVTIVRSGAKVEAVEAMVAHDRVTVIEPVLHSAMPELISRHRVAIGQLGTGALGQYELEAMACGIPLVADFRYSDAYPEGPPVVDASSTEAAASAVTALLDDSEARASLGADGRAWVRRNHAARSVAERVLADDLRILGARP